VAAPVYRRLIREIVPRNPARGCADSDRLVIPGFDGLALVQPGARTAAQRNVADSGDPISCEATGGWYSDPEVASGTDRSTNWCGRCREDGVPLVHLFRFPRIIINHGIVVYGMTAVGTGNSVETYDPNIPEHPVKLIFDRIERIFNFPPASYWLGGPLSVIEIYRRRSVLNWGGEVLEC